MFSERQRKRIENMIAWADAREAECLRDNRPGAANHHKAKASALRAALAEIDRLSATHAIDCDMDVDCRCKKGGHER